LCPRPLERFVCSLEGVMTSPQDVASRSPLLVEQPVTFIGKPLTLIGDSLALIREPLALIGDPLPVVRELLALVGGAISLVCPTLSLVKLAPQLLKPYILRHYWFRLSPILCHSSACQRARWAASRARSAA
jgi:hypothetical protein